jgi:hypothetical protein
MQSVVPCLPIIVYLSKKIQILFIGCRQLLYHRFAWSFVCSVVDTDICDPAMTPHSLLDQEKVIQCQITKLILFTQFDDQEICDYASRETHCGVFSLATENNPWPILGVWITTRQLAECQ